MKVKEEIIIHEGRKLKVIEVLENGKSVDELFFIKLQEWRKNNEKNIGNDNGVGIIECYGS